MKSKQKKTNLISKNNKKEILYNIINAALAGGLVFFGALVNGGYDIKAIIAAVLAAGLTAMIKFKDYWDGEKPEYCTKLINFV